MSDLTRDQWKRIGQIANRCDVDVFEIHEPIPAGSRLVLGKGPEKGHVVIVEIVEPTPTHRVSYDTGDDGS